MYFLYYILYTLFMSNPKKNSEPPMLSYHGTLSGLIKAVWLPLLVLVVGCAVAIVSRNLADFNAVAVVPLAFVWFSYWQLRYMIKNTQHRAVALHWRGGFVGMVLLLGMWLALPIIVFLRFFKIIDAIGSRLESVIVMVSLSQAITLTIAVYLTLYYLSRCIQKEASKTELHYNQRVSRLFVVFLLGLTLRAAIHLLLLTPLQVEHASVAARMMTLPFVYDAWLLLDTFFGKNIQGLIVGAVALLLSLIWLRLSLPYVMKHLQVQGRSLAMRGYFSVMLGVGLAILFGAVVFGSADWLVGLRFRGSYAFMMKGYIGWFATAVALGCVAVPLVLRQLCYADQRVGKD
jgi:hypothetical protein